MRTVTRKIRKQQSFDDKDYQDQDQNQNPYIFYPDVNIQQTLNNKSTSLNDRKGFSKLSRQINFLFNFGVIMTKPDLDHNGRGFPKQIYPNALKVHGQIYQILFPMKSKNPSGKRFNGNVFWMIYDPDFIDKDNEVRDKQVNYYFKELNPILKKCNPVFKKLVQIGKKVKRDPYRTLNDCDLTAPINTSGEIAAVFSNTCGTELIKEKPPKRNYVVIPVQKKSNNEPNCQYIPFENKFYESYQYVLLFPQMESGWYENYHYSSIFSTSCYYMNVIQLIQEEIYGFLFE